MRNRKLLEQIAKIAQFMDKNIEKLTLRLKPLKNNTSDIIAAKRASLDTENISVLCSFG